MSIKLSISEIKQRLKKVHGDIVVLDESTYINTYTKAIFIDRDFGRWSVEPNYVLNSGTGHPKRGLAKQSKSRTTSIAIVKQNLYKVHGNTLSIDESTYVNTQVKCIFIDIKYGEFRAKPNTIICRGQGHPKRANEKYRETMLGRYGVENASQSKEIREKIKQTFLKNYGVSHPFQSEKIREKIKQTCLERYGVENVSQSPEIALKSAKSQNNSYLLKHWFSREEIVAVGSYEKKTVEYFNENRIDYNWQAQTFLMPDGRTFRPDCYLPDENKWIEIKGYFRDDAQEKWAWFSNNYPNSELWDKNKLTDMKVL